METTYDALPPHQANPPDAFMSLRVGRAFSSGAPVRVDDAGGQATVSRPYDRES